MTIIICVAILLVLAFAGYLTYKGDDIVAAAAEFDKEEAAAEASKCCSDGNCKCDEEKPEAVSVMESTIEEVVPEVKIEEAPKVEAPKVVKPEVKKIASRKKKNRNKKK